LIQPLPDSEISGAISFEFQSRPFFPDLAKHQISTASGSGSLRTWHSLTSHLEPLSPTAHNTLSPLTGTLQCKAFSSCTSKHEASPRLTFTSLTPSHPGTLRNLVFLVH
jgi:hypothetical protein